MKIKAFLFLLLIATFVLFVTNSCTKTVTKIDTVTVTDTVTAAPVYPIDGLWEGTYLYNGQPPLYFSFAIYKDGTLSYKNLGNNGYIFYANGTWTLTDSTFTYTVITTNNPGGIQSTQKGTANFSSSAGTLVGVNTDTATNASGTFSLKRDN